jgi:hypothetical protein
VKKTLVFLLALGCSGPTVQVRKPFRVSMLPVGLEVESLAEPADRPTLDSSKVARFPDEPIDGGEYCEGAAPKKDCRTLKPGILIDEAHYAETISDKSKLKRVSTELGVYQKLRTSERAAVAKAEAAYQERLSELENENLALQQPDLWSRMKFPVGFLLGASVTVLTAYATAHAVR